MKIAVIGNYIPRKCGIATYTENFVQSLLKIADSQNQIDVFAMNDREEGYDYPEIVKLGINQNKIEDYYTAIKIINQGNYDYCHIQHEYGIFGGHSGLFVNILIAQIKIPLFITLHSVLKSLNFHQQQILENMVLFSTQLIVMSKYALEILNSYHRVPKEKISNIQHGAPSYEKQNKLAIKNEFGWSEFIILMTFGLIGPSKGIETALKALPKICKIHPNIRYVILGKTHPHIVKNEGEVYRDYLMQLTCNLGIRNNVIFLDKYVREPELTKYLSACDIYLTPYNNENQSTSGTLTYAVASGAAIISTPYWHALELLGEGRGILFDFNAFNQLEKAIFDLLNHPEKLKAIQEAAYSYGKTISWSEVSIENQNIVQNLLSRKSSKNPTIEEKLLNALSEFSLNHFYSLTDSTGLLQHATYTIPDYSQGYCTDDNARALLMAVKLNRFTHSKESEKLITKFLSFLDYMQIENGTFINMLSYSKNHLSNNKSEDAFGRSIWALGYTIKYAPLINQKEFANKLFLKAMPNFKFLNDLRGIAGSIMGIVFYLKNYPENETLKMQLKEFLSRLADSYNSISDKNWHWYEDKISYDNAILPLSMFTGAAFLNEKHYLKMAMKSLTFLETISFKNNHLSLIGNENWLEKGQQKSLFSQQPIDALSFTLIYQCLYKITNDKKYKTKMKTSFSWFLGNNDLFTSVYDKNSKGCSDGLFKDSLNLNQGGESLLAWLISYLTYRLAEEDC